LNAPDSQSLASKDAPAHLGGVARYEILDTPPEPAFDDLARRAAEACEAAMSGISFFERSGAYTPREWFKSRQGFPVQSLPLEQSFFQSALQQAQHSPVPLPKVFVINDTQADPRVREKELVVGAPYVAFYAAVPIYSNTRELIGALSVLDIIARQLSPQQTEALINLADLASARLEARLVARHELNAAPSPSLRAQAEDLSNLPAEVRAQRLTQEFLRLEQALEDEIEVRHAAEAKLQAEKAFSDAAIQSLPGAFFMIDRNQRLVRWNHSFQIHSGFSEDELSDMRALDFIADRDRAVVADALARVLDRSDEVSVEAAMRAKDGREAPYAYQARALSIGGERYCIGVGRDVSDRKRAEEEIRAAKERLDLALLGSSLAMWDWDLVSNMVYFNHGWATLLGAAPREDVVPGPAVLALAFEEDQPRMRVALEHAIKSVSNDFDCEYRVLGVEGNTVWLHTLGKVTERSEDGMVRRMTGTSANITKRKQAEERAEFLATRDPLTGLPNRMLVNDRLEQGIANAARKQARLAFMFIDLDRFKTINDSLGHDVGDELLKRVATRLSACVRASDTVARLGGDEFAVILENLPANDQEGAQNVAEKMIASLASPIMINGQQLNTSCSIGIGMFPADGTNPQTLMKHADVAMYDAKAKGRNNYQFFSHAMNAKAQERLSVENYLRLALRRNELVVYYQPRVSFKTGKITGMEALIRWQHPRHGLVLPSKFISVAEDAGLIVPMGEWVMETAFSQLAIWQKRSGMDLTLAVNLSVGQLVDGERLMRAVVSTAQAVGVDMRSLELELTESMLLKNSEDTAKVLHRLGSLGIGIAIDDFGTGYSSLSYLKQLPVDTIKVDSSFVRDIGTDPNDEAIIRAIIAMTHSLKLNVVAEGVEREDQYRVLRDLDCDEYQGFFCSPALPPAEFEAQFLDTRS
jgi:diguanylate cyclase (GGDEF)-like protein/PAS domain S-box-containing protein